MARRTPLLLGLGLILAVAGAGVTFAQSDPAVESARAAGLVGEQSDGYLGFPKAPAPSLKSAVDAINIKRRAVYTDLAAKRGVTVQEVAGATACELLNNRVAQGQMYRTESGTWKARAGAVDKPSFCP